MDENIKEDVFHTVSGSTLPIIPSCCRLIALSLRIVNKTPGRSLNINSVYFVSRREKLGKTLSHQIYIHVSMSFV